MIGKCCRRSAAIAIDLGLRLLDADARLQPADHAEHDVVAVRGFEVDARRRPHVRRALDVDARRQQQLEARREDADDVRAAVAEIDVLADDRLIAAEAAHPERMAENRGRPAAPPGRPGPAAAARGVPSSSTKSRPTSMRAPSTRKRLGVAPPTRICSGSPPGAASGTRPAGIIPAMSSKTSVDCCCRSRRSGGENGQSLTLRARSSPQISTSRCASAYGKRPQQHGVDDAEDRRAGADAERDRDRRDGREAEVLAQPAGGVDEILEECVHGCPRRRTFRARSDGRNHLTAKGHDWLAASTRPLAGRRRPDLGRST